MIKLGFSLQWVELLMRCVSSVSYSFLLNGQVQGFSMGCQLPQIALLYLTCLFANDSLIFCRARACECIWLRQCLQQYATASGQIINFDKSALSFSPNAGGVVRNEICALFGISQVEGHDMYLGLPTFSIRNKRLQFSYIQDRVIKKLQGWKEKFFSQGGKEVLIKAVVQAIPPYAMSCFIIPDSIIKDIESACARFWWAMLGKQVWRIITRPDSLIALRWRVGDGSSVMIYHSRWLPTPMDFKVSSPPSIPIHSTVSTLIAENGRWNESLIRSSFLDFEADLILSLPRPLSSFRDSYCWHIDKRGNFSVKSAYHLGLEFDGFAMAVWEAWNLQNSWVHGASRVIIALCGSQFVFLQVFFNETLSLLSKKKKSSWY
ncbi:hypothetical protein UlMin_018401 [Ulmus minor]